MPEPVVNYQFSNTFLSLLKRSQRIVVSTGAGISEESGVPTFRGPGGLWNDFKPEDLATPEAFARDPAKVWEWYNWRRELLKNVQPNAGHIALAELERMVPQLTLVTQNIDGLHQKSGSRSVQELHGNIWRVRCDLEHRTFDLPESPIQKLPPECECGQQLRPDVVWFGEPLPYEPTSRSWQAARQCEVFFLVGSSATVQPAASLPWVALEHGALVVEINPEETPVTAIAHESFRSKSGEILPHLIEAIRNHE